MWTYIIRRLFLMLPTLFGVTVVSFCIMQMAPGDPLLSKLGSGGTAGESSQTREAYLIQKRDLKLDRPLLLNFNYFRDFSSDVRVAAYFRARTREEIAADLLEYAAVPAGAAGLSPEQQTRLQFLERLRISRFDERLRPPTLTPEQLAASELTAEQWQQRVEQGRLNLAQAVEGFVQIWNEDLGKHGAPAAIQLLKSDSTERGLRIGAIKSLNSMVVSPFEYTFSTTPTAEEAVQVVSTWKILWEQERAKFSTVPAARKAAVLKKVEALVAEGDRAKTFAALQSGDFERDDAPIFVDLLMDESPVTETKLATQAIAAEFLRLYISRRVTSDVARDASDADIQAATSNWLAHYTARQDEYEVGFGKRLWYIIGDTQYAHMVWRLATFNFGRSALKTREPVSQKIWSAVVVSAPLMLLAELVIYFVAVPLGVLCGVYRGRWFDRLVSLKLFFLFSVPPFVAGMMFLLFFCYGSYFKWFPMERLHGPNAENLNGLEYLLDYLWHAFLPVTCLSLFSLAGLAMYSRNSMLDVLGQDYIRTARAKGLPQWKVILKHALRNGLIPIITLFASFIPAMLGGSVLVEYLFNIPGMGRLSFNSIEQKDYPTLMALVYIDAIVVMCSILVTDLLYVLVDPRISFDSQGKSA